ncbi:hypothetical protein CG006_01790 [Mesoplasma florum]|uniref:hypothetical protein n=1 Tax=Mesoplasma florum TaxID=2151 RepID=UPI000D0285AB|nr:hypothetical protein [Mesoplasma florum]AVN63709.1 hypothetical protein CG006_01790 [Mesoplasma florum]
MNKEKTIKEILVWKLLVVSEMNGNIKVFKKVLKSKSKDGFLNKSGLLVLALFVKAMEFTDKVEKNEEIENKDSSKSQIEDFIKILNQRIDLEMLMQNQEEFNSSYISLCSLIFEDNFENKINFEKFLAKISIMNKKTLIKECNKTVWQYKKNEEYQNNNYLKKHILFKENKKIEKDKRVLTNEIQLIRMKYNFPNYQ